jgi:RND family efflux transporter MFP subunit
VAGGLAIATAAYILTHRNHTVHGVVVKTATVQTGQVTQQIFSTGTVASTHTANLFPPSGVSGTPNIKVSVGQHVSQGQALAAYPTESLRSQVNSARVALAAEGNILHNARQLVTNADNAGIAHNSNPYIQLEQSVQADDIQYNNAKAQLEQAQRALTAATITSPFAGTVVAVSQTAAAPQAGGGPLVRVADLKSLQVDAALSQANSALVTTGKKVVITASAFPGQSWNGTVKLVAPTATSQSNSSANVNVTVSVPKNFPIHPGFNVNLTIDAKSVTGLTIPYTALVENGNGSQVWVVKSGQVHLVSVNLGVTGNKVAQVTSGLSAGSKVVVNPPQGLVSGEDVSTK